MDSVPQNSTEILFNMTWRSLSYAAVPKMLASSDLDENGLIPREFCPQVYDGVKSLVTAMSTEAQYAVWYWVVPPPAPPSSPSSSPPTTIGWHPSFTLPANRRIIPLPSTTITITNKTLLDSPATTPTLALPPPSYTHSSHGSGSGHRRVSSNGHKRVSRTPMPPVREESTDSQGGAVESRRKDDCGGVEVGVGVGGSGELHVRKRRTASGTVAVRPVFARS